MYELIYTDPAWPYFGSATKDAAAGKHYDLMDWQDLSDMPVKVLCAKRAYCFMWATSSFLHRQIAVMEDWGFHYRGVGFVWVKTRKDGGIIAGQGVPATFVKPTTEFLLVGTTNKTGRPYPILTQSMGQVVLAPREEHSKKPDVFRDKIVEVVGDRPRLEMFARQRSEGWDSSGIELNGIDYKTGVLA